MNRIKRRRLTETALLGVTLTLLVFVADRLGALHSLDEWAYDRRVRDCQIFSKAPTDGLVHLDIDDRSIDVIGRWPWPRARQAEILEELRLAGPKVVAMDLHLSKPEEVEGENGETGVGKLSKGDIRFAEALAHLGNAVISMEFSLAEPAESAPIVKAIRAELNGDLEIAEGEVAAHLVQRGFDAAAVRDTVGSKYIETRRNVMFERVVRSLDGEGGDLAAVSKRLLKPTAAELNSPLKRVLAEQYERAIAERQMRRFALPAADVSGGHQMAALVMAGVQQVPLPAFSRATASAGFVDWKFNWQVCRSIPLLLEYEHRLYPQFGLVVACRMLEVNPADIRLEDDRLILPKPDGSRITIPLRVAHWEATGQDVPSLMDIPFFGTTNWTTSFDWPNHINSKQHISMNLVWDAVLIQRRIAENNKDADIAIQIAFDRLDDKEAKQAYLARKLLPADGEARLPVMQAILDRKDVKAILEITGGFKPEELEKEDQDFLAAVRVLRLVPDQYVALRSQLRQKRAELASHVKDRAVLIGWTSGTTIADFVPTAMHAKCPGVVVHGTVINAILTNRFWWAAPGWIAVLLTLTFGLLTAGAAVVLTPGRGFLFAAALGIGYLLINGLVVFGRYHVLLALAGPLCVIAVVWSACTLAHFLLETKERAIIERRFRSYVDPSLVEYCVEHSNLTHMEGEIREVTVCFTDLAGFTAISEKLGAKTVSLLNEYWEEMIPIVRRNRGFVAKFMGDGLFFFYGAPRVSATHAVDAVQSILEKQKALVRFNAKTAERGLPALGLRAGINSGNAVVGDAGTRDASDYTALGDVTNLGSRLENANKFFGTRNLLTQRTADLCAGRFLLRPIGTICVFGKSEGVATYEAISVMAEATDEQRRLVELSDAVVRAFHESRFTDCRIATDALAVHTGPSKLTALYRSLCERYIETPPENFDGCIVLNEK
jgi:class 3 adenylate cyclase/CHASE2 domain-containing sensor protein